MLWHASRDTMDQAFCVNFILQATIAFGILLLWLLAVIYARTQTVIVISGNLFQHKHHTIPYPMTSSILGEMVTLQHISRDKQTQTYCMNFILQATNTQGIGTRLGFSLASQTQPTLSRSLLVSHMAKKGLVMLSRFLCAHGMDYMLKVTRKLHDKANY